MKIQSISILAAVGVVLVGFVFLQGKPRASAKPDPVIIYQPSRITVEFTKNNELMPPVHVDGAASIHIISDESGKLSDIQVFPLPN